ncbi:MAG: S9 family peptidase [Planctomycetes bacterium]|nr:S9 family peptidase [Planctomycetota bacterium]
MTCPTEKKPVVDVYHGTTITDEYRWLEDWSNPVVQTWSHDQNAHTRKVLDDLPSAAGIRQRITELEHAVSSVWWDLDERHGTLFAMKYQPEKQKPFLVVMASPDEPASEKVLVDPSRIDPQGKTSIDWYVPSPDGMLVAVSLSECGAESGTVHVYETAGGNERGADVIPRVNGGTAEGSLTWKGDGSGFYYTRYPRGIERAPADMDFYQQVSFHVLGTPTAQDVYAIGKDFPRIAEVQLDTSDDGQWVLASVANGDGGEYEHHLLGPSGTWTRLTSFADKVVRVKLGPDGVYLLSHRDAPLGKLLRLAPEAPLEKATVVLPQGDVAIQDFAVTAGCVVVSFLDGGPSRLAVYDHAGQLIGKVPLPKVSAVGELCPVGEDVVLFPSKSYLQPPAWYRLGADASAPQKTKLASSSIADFSDTEVLREMVTSQDGTKVPINILRRKGTRLDGSHPTILFGYGGYGLSLTPTFSPPIRLWLEQGGVYVYANLRGGGEYGEAWHEAGKLVRKQNVFADFAACAQWLIDFKYTTPAKLGIYSRSNGGLLMGAALTQHPELYRAVVAAVGMYDMLRFELSPNGAFNVPEFGTVQDPAQFQALLAYSPYHQVRDGVAYPAVLLSTGSNDARVDPMHSRKMAARLQAATSSNHPILLRTTDEGHGFPLISSLQERVDEQTDFFAFFCSQLGVTYRPAGIDNPA